MRADNAQAPIHYRPGPGHGWTRFAREFDNTFRTEGIGNVEEQPFNSRFAAFPPGHPAYYRYAVFQLYQSLLRRDRWNAFEQLRQTQHQETTKHKHVLEFGRTLLSWDLLISVQHLFSIAEGVPHLLTDPVVVLDLGSGWGRLGHALLRINAQATYVSVDIPETLLIAQHYLPKTLSGIRFYNYPHHKGRDLISRSELLTEPGAHFLGTHMLPHIENGAADVFVNVFSFQEMTNTQVRCYFADIDRLTRGHFYLQQVAATKYRDGFILVGDDYYPFLAHWQRVFLRPCEHVPDYFEALYRISRA